MMMRSDSHSLRPFKNPTYVDYLVGWRYLFNQNYRAHVHNRWSNQPWIISGAEMLAGIGSVLFTSSLVAIMMFIIWDMWLK
jgi:hypothetical protein